MPSENDHLSLAQHNQELLDHLLPEVQRFPDWVVTVAFYKAMHLIEAVLSRGPGVRHTFSHDERAHVLKSNNSYSHLWKMYRPLHSASTVARYLEDKATKKSYSTFSDYLAPSQVESKILKHYLAQVQNTASKLLGVRVP